MAITKSSLSTSFSFSPNYSRISKHPSQTNFIIIEEIINGISSEVSGQPVWLKVASDGTISETSNPGTNAVAFSPSHSNGSTTRIYVKGNQVIIVRYGSSTMIDFVNAQEVTEYALGTSGDVLYLKIDHSANTVTVYHP